MREKELRRSLSVLPIGTVMKLTNLSARQIRYYEEQKLVSPERNDGNRRMYSLNDVDRILDIKDYLDEGLNIAKIQSIYKHQEQLRAQQKEQENKGISDAEARKLLQDELMNMGGLETPDDKKYPF